MKRNVVFFVSGLGMGGAEMNLLKLCKSIDKSQFDLSIISLKERSDLSAEFDKNNIEVLYLDLACNPLAYFFAIFKVLSFLKPKKNLVYQGWMYHGNVMAHIAALFRKPESLFLGIRQTLYNIKNEKFLTQLFIKLDAFLSSRADKTVYVAHSAVEQHLNVGYSPDNVLIIPNGFDVNYLKFSEESRKNVRTELGLTADNFVLGHVARYHKMKDHLMFFKSVVPLVEKNKNIHVVLVGKNVTDDKEWASLIKNPEIRNNFHFLGIRKDVNALNSGFDVGVSSSSYGEGFSNSIAESMCCGLPCVVTDIGDSAWIVKETGKVVQARNVEEMQKALSFFVELDKPQFEQYRKMARQRIIDHFSIEQTSQTYMKLWS